MHTAFFELIAANRGLVTTAGARDRGVTTSSLRRFVERGELVRMHRNVYRHASTPVTYDLRLRAGLLAVGTGGVASHRSALARHGVRSFTCDLVELTNTSLSLPIREGVMLHRSRVLDEPDIVQLDGLRWTSPARTLVDTSMVLPAVLVNRYAQAWIADRKVKLDDVHAALDRAGNHPGARRLRPLLGELVEDVDSVAEARLGSILGQAGIAPELHTLVTTAAGHTFELDWSYPSLQIGLEVDGYGIHLRSSHAFDADRWRRNELEIDGWQILNFTARHLRRPSSVVSQVRRALARRET